MQEKEVRTSRPLRMTNAEWDAFKRLLGPEWVRGQIAKAIKREQRKPVGIPRI